METRFADNDNVRFIEIQNSVRAHLPLLEKYDVVWNALIVRKGSDILIEPKDINQLAMFDLKNTQEVTKKGYLAAVEKMKEDSAKQVIKRCLQYNELNKMVKEYIKNTRI